jgi:hypothetical protein
VVAVVVVTLQPLIHLQLLVVLVVAGLLVLHHKEQERLGILLIPHHHKVIMAVMEIPHQISTLVVGVELVLLVETLLEALLEVVGMGIHRQSQVVA